MTDQSSELVKMWQEAMALKNAQRWQEAARVFERILLAQPDWEHGYGQFNLAECYEGAGRISDAEVAYRSAIRATPTDPTLLGGLASFLYLHGQPKEAFDEHVRLLRLEEKQGNIDGVACTTTALKALGLRLGWSDAETTMRITQASQTGNWGAVCKS